MSKWSILGLGLAVALIIVGVVLGLMGMPVTEGGVNNAQAWFADGLWSSGVFSAGIFSIGVYSIGIFSIGIFSLGIFSIGVFSLGIFAIGWFVTAQYAMGKVKKAGK
ncbi:MAG: hypothetical protein HY671_03260 [Chloroflexi bacterium]|nr:hypothetical protein [Chloroflexota bacterium]